MGSYSKKDENARTFNSQMIWKAPWLVRNHRPSISRALPFRGSRGFNRWVEVRYRIRKGREEGRTRW